MKYLRIFSLLLIFVGIGVFLTGWGKCMDVKSPGCPAGTLLSYFVVTGAAIFLLGIALLLISFIWKKVRENKNPSWPTKSELYVRRFFGAALFLIAFPGVMWAGALIPFCLIFGIYLLRVEKRHLFFDLIFTVIFFLPYWLTVPLLGPAAIYLKFFFLTSDWGGSFVWLITLTCLTKVILFGSTLALFIADILVFIPPFRRLTKRALISNLILLIAVVSLFIIPLFRRPVPVIGKPNSWGSAGCPPSMETIKYDKDNVFASRDEKNNWVYQIKAQTYSKEDAEIIEIIAQKPKNALFSRKEIIGPPFGENIDISIGNKTAEKIIIPAGKDFTLRIFSQEPIYDLSITSKNNCGNNFAFLELNSLIGSVAIEVEKEEKINPDLRIVLSDTFPPGDDTVGRDKFKVGEAFYPNEIGLPKDSLYDFQIINESGNPVNGLYEKSLNLVKFEERMEGAGTFNSAEDLFKPGNYVIHLVQMIDGRAYIVAKKDFIIED